MKTYELRFRCKHLLKRDPLSKSDPFVQVTDSYRRPIDITETIINDSDPIFLKAVLVNQRRFPVFLNVFDRDSNQSDGAQGNELLGKSEAIYESDLVAGDKTVTIELKGVELKKGELSAGYLTIKTEDYRPIKPEKLSVSLKFNAKIAPPFNHVGVDIYRKNERGGGWTRVYRSDQLSKRSDAMGDPQPQVELYLSLNVPIQVFNIGEENRDARIVIHSVRTKPATSFKSRVASDLRQVYAVFGTTSKMIRSGMQAGAIFERVDFEVLKDIGMDEPDYTSAKRDVSLVLKETFLVR
uniref:C2 domain-containing protein n=1 Tax=Rhodosorus marinus TaxID=101924 RepID=A0A7S2ZYB4_9RHOD|mmetsp:Transcript_33700/g.132612  ORF Transcript_33700/g.132612 Transcript_33700/m.132612 type:complete len:296 (+) Transcript_33700:158-1045(+)|eukprot:CAMPEP_0113969690 /NCGR_PEP_ID=MMETSP0011_2-20120614/10521_1 /TAXON_ID=101924 /ORGANISM="Rhodosorus marinus" /LENGTH=295 /DNA_ID=CAMNT_0000983503 /DNA_START=99 /DNA_END=986 /DNA_ORIENTATION=+ /assembly_acc=CAM_ASM_000156